jgi:hypothetical protein
MYKTKLIASILVAIAVLFAQVGIVAAAPTAQDTTPITGTIESITTEIDTNGVTTVLVAIVDDLGATQTVRVSVVTAAGLGLVTIDPVSNEVVIVDSQVGQSVDIDPATVITDEPTEESLHPIAVLLAAFFGEDGSVVNGYHEAGYGFGVIAQALWMSKNINDDASLAGDILQAKKDGDYSAFFPEGTENVPTNWGQFKKAVSEKKNNLGIIVSGQADPDQAGSDATLNPSDETEHGNGKDKNKGNGKGKDKNKNKP